MRLWGSEDTPAPWFSFTDCGADKGCKNTIMMRLRESSASTGYFCYLPQWVKFLVVPGMWLLLQVLQSAPSKGKEAKCRLLPPLQLMWVCMTPWLSRGFDADNSLGAPVVLVGPLLQMEMLVFFFSPLSSENAAGGPFSSGRLIFEITELS